MSFDNNQKVNVNKIAYGECPECNNELLIKHVGKSSFIACSTYPDCKYTQALGTHQVSILKHIDESQCPLCGAVLAVKKGRYGMFIGCTEFPSCQYISTNQDKNKEQHYEPVPCPQCDEGKLVKKQNRFGKYFYSCDQYPRCKCIVNSKPINHPCPNCQSTTMMLKGKSDNTYVCWNKNCQFELVNE